MQTARDSLSKIHTLTKPQRQFKTLKLAVRHSGAIDDQLVILLHVISPHFFTSPRL